MGYAKLFRSRWAALLWAAGILWTAIDVAGISPAVAPGNDTAATAPAVEDATGLAVNDSDLAILANVMKDN